MTPVAEHLVGRGDELGSLERILDELSRGHPGAVEVAGEPGIGKSRLLMELAARAEARGHLVLSGAAAELERDLPFSVFVDALDQYVAGIEPNRLAELDGQIQAELGHVFPSLWALSGTREVAPQQERYHSHRAVRRLVELLAQSKPLVLMLDDFHWADSGSVELLGALLRRPPAAPVLLALALRPRQTPERLGAALERAHRAAALTRIEVGALTPDEARELLGRSVDEASVAALYQESGGNPFYLEQLARSLERSGAIPPGSEISQTDIGISPAVSAALSEELALLSADTRVVLEGASVAGDPFEPELAADAAATSEAAAMNAIDELLQLDLIRATDVPRRFRFRHPLVRRAVYEATAAGWRLGAHERCAAALAAQGATASTRAHHVEGSAREGDPVAVQILRKAGEEATRLAPASAARWFASALRLLAQTAPAQERVELLLLRAAALAATGHYADSHEVLLEALETVPDESIALRARLTARCAGVERLLGRYEQAHARLLRALRSLPEPASDESAALLIELTVNEFYRSRYQAMHDWAGGAVDSARVTGDTALMAATLAVSALAYAITGPTETALSHRAEAAALVDGLSDDELSLRLDAAGWLAAAELYLDLYVDADTHASRVLALGRAKGRADPFFRLYQILPRIWYARAKLAEATELLDGAIEAVRLLGTPPALAGNLFNRSVVAVAVGDLEIAVATAEEAFRLTRDLDEGFVTAWAAMRLAGVLLETGQPVRAVELLFGRAGGDELTFIPGGWRAYALELLTRCWLALERYTEAERAAALAEATAAAMALPLAVAWAERAAAAVALHAGDSARAAERALASADVADAVGAPIEAALSRTLAGRALAEAGEKERAVAELQRAAAALDRCGATRYRQRAERELGRLGHRPHRRSRPGTSGGPAIESLTEREREVARLVVDRRTNPEIAAQLFLSQKTVETHLRNIFNKLGVADRVALARTVERAYPKPTPPTRGSPPASMRPA
jgi:ATP/maltotriose-dependent transcriptional regulator MalT